MSDTEFIEWDGGRIRLRPGDCRDLIASLPDASVDAVVTDPPYEIGFMGRAFDSTGIAFDRALWADVLRVLKPGGHLLAFGATRTYHRLACAVEDAGFEIRGQIDWIYAEAMPHGSDAGLLVDRALGAVRPRGSERVPATPQGAEWAGWFTQLKPAHEPVCLARRPLEGTLAANLMKWGTGALHIDACRVPSPGGHPLSATRRDNNIYGRMNRSLPWEPGDRFAPDILLDPAAAAALDAQSGYSVSRRGRPRASAAPGAGWGMTRTGAEYDDEGGASRYYPVFRYEPKAPARERPRADGILHPTVKPLGLMRWLVRLATPADGLVLEPFAGSGATLQACRVEGMRCVAAEMDDGYVRLVERRMERPVTEAMDV
ncbi:DNA-methyltransferase [Bifidobacterium myosotis]|uniref:Methyltransferase n=1 Tax=Bifidobacterium myosotis TaxID=1630166 RepID=A0A5M9ZKF9_9BIFI|nr:DNA methyltransferase [Bifidobacterium myosotis]KAA8828106.1 site-specific DNA-methyltransferase [Bifidobacterium myosotis]